MDINSRYSKIVRRMLAISLSIIIIGIVLLNLGIGESSILLWMGIVFLDLVPLLGLSILLIHYIEVKDRKTFIIALIIIIFIIINILINFLVS